MAMLFIYDHHMAQFRCAFGPPSHGPLETRALWQGHGGYPAWSDERLLQAYEAVCRAFGPVWIGACFKRTAKGQSAHYAGLALDMGQSMPPSERAALYRFCLQSPLFSYVEPGYLTPSWVHAEISIAPPCIPGRGYPFLKPGDAGPHVFILQEKLCRLGFPCLLCGHFTESTRRALVRYQRKKGLADHGFADGVVWSSLTS